VTVSHDDKDAGQGTGQGIYGRYRTARRATVSAEGSTTMTDPLAELSDRGVSIWLDDLSRPRLTTGPGLRRAAP